MTAILLYSAEACKTDEYACPRGGCIPLAQLCDGIKHCNWGHDETYCRKLLNLVS